MNEEETKVNKKTIGAIVIAGVLVVGCAGTPDTDSEPTFPIPTTTVEKPTVITKPPKVNNTKPTISGDDLVHIGEDVPEGTYRANEGVDGFCFWTKSKDAEAKQIIDIGSPSGGKPQVTLKKGQWFTTHGCPTWVKQ